MTDTAGAPLTGPEGFQMKMLQGAALAAAIAFGCATAGAAQAQVTPRNYELGPVWTVAYIETKTGMLNDYMAYLAGPYAALQEAAKKRGEVLDYKVLSVNSARDGEANLILMVQFKNMAVFDRTLAQGEQDTTAVFGSLAQGRQSQIKRDDMRVTRGAVLVRELKFIK